MKKIYSIQQTFPQEFVANAAVLQKPHLVITFSGV